MSVKTGRHYGSFALLELQFTDDPGLVRIGRGDLASVVVKRATSVAGEEAALGPSYDIAEWVDTILMGHSFQFRGVSYGPPVLIRKS